MAYRYQVTSVGWWRGKIKRWNTTFHLANAGFFDSIRDKMQAVGWPNPGDVVGNCSGGVASIAVYNASGGAPITNTIYFDWETPSTWIPYTGTAWLGVDPDTPLDASGESALVIVGNMAALSASGKPVTTRKYFHAIPSRQSLDYTEEDVDPTAAANLATVFQVGDFRNPAGVAPASLTVERWYLNHQRVRGRRRTTRQVATDAFAGGVAVGASSSVGGGGQPFQSQ